MFDSKKTVKGLIGWVRDYFALTTAKAVVGISGGKDSSVVAALCAAALGKDRVIGVLMPDGTQPDIDVSYRLCKALGIEYVEINIQNAVAALYKELRQAGLKLNDVVTINTPARVRMTTLYAVSAAVGGRVANTCNLSEDYVGYSTKYGDSAGDFSPLCKLTVAEVKEIGRQLGLAEEFIEKTPSDGLSGQSDEDKLGFSYAVLDRYIREGVIEDKAVKTKIDKLHAQNLHKLLPMPFFNMD